MKFARRPREIPCLLAVILDNSLTDEDSQALAKGFSEIAGRQAGSRIWLKANTIYLMQDLHDLVYQHTPSYLSS